jgi:DNA-binding CsgD family transcriptional regulator
VTALLCAAADGHGGALLFHGDAGSGKTAMLAAAVAQATSFAVLTAAGWESESRLAFAGLHRMLRPALGGLDNLPAAQARALMKVLETGGCASGEEFAVSAALLALLSESAAERPLLCCIDDAHWMDRPSLDVLAFAARRIDTDRVAMLFATRGGPSTDLSGVPRHRLAELDHLASRDLLADLVTEGLAGDVAGVLATIAGGNPRALVDLARALTPEQRRGEAAPPHALPADSDLRRELQARLDELPSETRWLLLLLAADDELDVGGLIRAAAVSGVDIAALEPAERATIVRVTGNNLSFTQPLLGGIVYDDATLVRRRSAHRLLADTLDPERQPLRQRLHLAAVADGPDPALAAELEKAATAEGADRSTAARALERAADLTTESVEAAHYLVAAARHAWEAGEPHRARMLLRRVRPTEVPANINAQSDLLLGEIELRAGGTHHARQTLLAAAGDLEQDRDLAVNAMLRAGEATCQAGDYPNYPSIAKRALALRRTEEPLGAELIFEQFAGMTAVFKGRYAEAEAPLRKVARHAPELDDAAALTRGSVAAFLLGDDHQAYRLAVRAAAVARATGDATIVPQALEMAGAAEIALGRYDAATVTLMEALPLARNTGQESLASSLVATLALTAAIYGDRDTCIARVREARAHTSTHGVARAEALIEWALGLLDLVAGRPAEALGRLQGLISLRTGRGQLVIGVAATPHLVEAAIRCGDREAALNGFTIFEPWGVATKNPGWLALVARCRALLAEDEVEVQQHFRESLQHHASAESDFERARTELLYGQELRRRRRPSAAREHLRSALEGFQQFDAQPWVELASSELRAAGDHVEHRPQAAAEALTPQQLEIARLAAAGATNREVAAQMFLSTRTVDHHMRNIFARLGIRSRIDLAKLIM